MKKIILCIIFLALSLCYVGHASANIEFSIDVRQIMEKQNEDKSKTKEENNFEITVEIGDSYFAYVQKGKKYIYDFTNKRIFTLDLSAKMFSDDSLFSNIGFRTYEFRNRLMLGGAFEAASIEENPMLPVLSEHLFSLRQNDKKTELSMTEINDTFQFYSAEKELLSFSRQGTPVSHEDKIMFIKFFRYVFGGHPQILDTLASSDTIPASIVIHRYNIFYEKDSLTISAVKTIPVKPFSFEGYTSGVLPGDSDAFSKHLSDIYNSKKIDFQRHLDLLLFQSDEDFKKGNYLDTVLGYLEYNLASGLPFPPAFQEQRPAVTEDDNVKKLLSSLTPKNKEEAEMYLTALQSLLEKSAHRKHVIHIFEANVQTGLGNYQKAKELFYKALDFDPYITGAYKDLGELYLNEYNSVSAWRCWDAARKIAPAHNMLLQINELENNLLRDHPEFF